MKKILMFLLLFNLMGLTACNDVKEEVKPVIKEDLKEINLKDDEILIPLTDNYYILAKEDEFKYYDDYSLNKMISKVCHYEKESSNITIDDVLKTSLETKKQRLKENLELKKISKDDLFGDRNYRSNGKELLDMNDYRYLLRNDTNRNFKDVLTQEEALEDIKTLDLWFRSFYGPYKIIGRERFDKSYEIAKEQVLKHDTLTRKELMKIIYLSDKAIQDGHFRWNQYGFGEPKAFTFNETDGYYNDEYSFLKDDHGFYLKDYRPKVYLDSVRSDPDVSKYLNYSISDSGELVYIVSFLEQPAKFNTRILITINGIETSLAMNRMDSKEMTRKERYSFTIENGYPTVMIRTYYDEDIDYNHYHNLGKALKNERVVIQDSRSNYGGQPGRIAAFYDSLVPGLDTASHCMDGTGGRNSRLEDRFHQFAFTPYDKIVNNPNLFINVTNSSSGSGGDIAAINVDFMINGLNVGEPTSGGLMTGNGNRLHLPNSGIEVGMPTHLNPIEAKQLPDGTGHVPDIWVPSIEALDKTIKMLEYYHVEKSPNASKLEERYAKGTNDVDRRTITEREVVVKDYPGIELASEAIIKDNKLYFNIAKVKRDSSLKNLLKGHFSSPDIVLVEERMVKPSVDSGYYCLSIPLDKLIEDKEYQITLNKQLLKFRIVKGKVA